MDPIEKVWFERLGSEGLTRVLGDVLDQTRLVRLANACGLKYPGMRTLSQTRHRVLADLVHRAGESATTRRAIYRTLRKETRAAGREWLTLPDEEKARRLGDERFLQSNGNLGVHLFFLASSETDRDDGGFESLLARQQLLKIASNGQASATEPKRASREENRLRKRVNELEKKLQHVEGQLTKGREAERTIKRDLIQRKGELAESRMLAERLRADLNRAQAAQQASPKVKTAESAEEMAQQLGKSVRKLTNEQKKLSQRIEKLATAVATPPTLPANALARLADGLQALQKESAALRRESRKEARQQLEALEQLRAEGAAHAPARSRRQTKSDEKRVGVFIDVQNMYYGARRLKGKLDFDALMQAALINRRLIQATAYVVESKEIDQSGFIALLQQRGIEVRRKTLRVRADGSMKGDWDMDLALDILDAAPDLDVVVLVSGDGDFTSLIQRVKRMGPRVEVIGFPRTTAKSLVGAADRFQPLDRKFMIYTRRAKTGSKASPEPSET